MYTNSIYTGSKLLERIQMVAGIKAQAQYEDIGLIVPKVHAERGPYFIVSDNEMDRICTVTKSEIKTALQQGKID